MRSLILFLFIAIASSCGGGSTNTNTSPKPDPKPDPKPATVSSFEIVKEYKHDSGAFTQGLVFHNGYLYEGTGGSVLAGGDYLSSLRKVELESGKVLKKKDLPKDIFGEGIVVLKDKIYQLTWHAGIAYEYSLSDFKLLKEHRYDGQGWGLTTDGTNLIQSNGSHEIRIIEPSEFKTTRKIYVFDENGQPLTQLNELEYIKGEIWANIWQTTKIARIDPENGKLLGWIDLGKMVGSETSKNPDADVLNGIAYDPLSDRLFVTGKLWSRIFEIKLSPAG